MEEDNKNFLFLFFVSTYTRTRRRMSSSVIGYKAPSMGGENKTPKTKSDKNQLPTKVFDGAQYQSPVPAAFNVLAGVTTQPGYFASPGMVVARPQNARVLTQPVTKLQGLKDHDLSVDTAPAPRASQPTTQKMIHQTEMLRGHINGGKFTFNSSKPIAQEAKKNRVSKSSAPGAKTGRAGGLPASTTRHQQNKPKKHQQQKEKPKKQRKEKQKKQRPSAKEGKVCFIVKKKKKK